MSRLTICVVTVFGVACGASGATTPGTTPPRQGRGLVYPDQGWRYPDRGSVRLDRGGCGRSR
jgi:hypothetical protein